MADVDHPYGSAALVLSDGRTLPAEVSATGDRAKDEAPAEGTRTRAADLRAVLSRLERLDRGETEGLLAGRIGIGRAAAAGHSFGGAAAPSAARQDRRFDAVVDLDGFPHGPFGDRFEQPVLALSQEVGPGTDLGCRPRPTRVLEHSDATSCRLAVPGTVRLTTFSDIRLHLLPVPGVVGSPGRVAVHRPTGAG
ncbi:hypothetical protein [Streptomyces sp. SM11]|uniref:hypothetical protein n=1 Tax=Streptomyces sp. SM11 TaxID=565557 RepID=UPI0015E1983A|nr:hypothetical protein [Streptomyces sp. SM11]